MVLRQLKGNIKVEADGETILKRKQRWRLNECIMPEREVRLYVGELSTDALKKAGKNLKVKLSSLSTKSVVDKRQVHCNVIEWNWDEVKKETRIVVDILSITMRFSFQISDRRKPSIMLLHHYFVLPEVYMTVCLKISIP